MRDEIECMEDACERRFDEMTKGLPAGKFRCECGNIEEIDNGQPSGSSPFAMPICQKCFEKEKS